MCIIDQKIATDLPKDHKNTDPHLSRDLGHDLINIEQTALISASYETYPHDLARDQKSNDLHDLEAKHSKDHEQDHTLGLTNSDQTASNSHSTNNSTSDLDNDPSCLHAHDLGSQGAQSIVQDQSRDLNSDNTMASNQGFQPVPVADLDKDHSAISTPSLSNVPYRDKDHGKQTGCSLTSQHTVTADPHLAAADDAQTKELDLKHQYSREEVAALEERYEQLKAEMRQARKTIHDTNIKYAESTKHAKNVEKENNRLRAIPVNVETLINRFFSEVYKICKSQFESFSKPIDLGLETGNLSRLEKVLNALIKGIREVNVDRQANRAQSLLGVSLSEKSKASVPAVDYEDSDQHEDDESADTMAKPPRMRGSGAAKKPFGHNCKEVAEKVDEINSTSELAVDVLRYQKDNPLPKSQSSLLDDRQNYDVSMEALFKFCSDYLAPHFLGKKSSVQEKAESQNDKPDSALSSIKKINQIKTADYVIEPSVNSFLCHCRKCNKQSEIKILEKRNTRVTKGVALGLGMNAALTSSYLVFCPECKEQYVMTLTDMNVDKHVIKACVPHDEKDTLHIPEYQLYDLIEGSSLSKNDTKIKQDIRKIQANQQNKFMPEEAASKLESAEGNKKYRIQQTECAKRASDIKRQPHIRTNIGLSLDSIKECLMASLTPVFNGCTFNASVFAEMLAAEGGYNSNSRFHKTLLSQGVEQIMSRNRLNELSIIFSRAYLHGVCKQISKEILAREGAIHFDETPVRIVVPDDPEKACCQLGYIWAMCTSCLDREPMVYFETHNNRKFGSFISLIDGNGPGVNFKYAVTDGYAAYTKALEEMVGQKRKHAMCYAHFRRLLRQFLLEHGFIKVYDQLLALSDDDPSEFFRRLEELANPTADKEQGDFSLDSNIVLLLIIFHTINQLFVNDSYVIDSYDEHHTSEFLNELDAMRKEHSTYLVAALNVLIEAYIAANNTIRQSTNGKRFYKNLTRNKVSDFCLYWMNYRHHLIEFINEPRVQLSNNDIERAFRLPAISRHVKLSFKGMDGAHSFSDQMTILQNCNLCGVDVRLYIPWLVHKVQTAINNLTPAEVMEERAKIKENWPKSSKEIVIEKNWMPHKFTYGTGDEKVSLGLYDLDNPYNALFDKISYEGMTPQAYMREMQAGFK